MKSQTHSCLVAAVVLMGLGTDAWAFSAAGHRWPDASAQPVAYALAPQGSDDVGAAAAQDAARRAFESWASVSCSHLRFEEAPFVAPAAGLSWVANDGQNRVFWVEQPEAWPGDASTLALTYTFYTLDENRSILDSDVILNGVHFAWTTDEAEAGQGQPPRFDVQTVLVHEIGHFFGLDHSQDPAAAMFGSNNKTLQREPADNDVEGICAIYPNGEPLPHDPGQTQGNPVGAACTDPSDCASSTCIEDEAYDDTYCSQSCTPGLAEQCPLGFECFNAGSRGAYCLRPAPIDELCDQCNLHEHCVSGLCVGVPFRNGNAPFCTVACTPDQANTCPDGFECEITQQQTTQIAVCVPSSGVCEPRGLGGHLEPCYGNGTCKPGHGCFEHPQLIDIAFCYALCDIGAAGASCGTERSICAAVPGVMNTAACYEIARAGEPCVPEACDENSMCLSADGSFDSALCYGLCRGGTDVECPTNYACLAVEGFDIPVCVPNEGFRALGESCQSDAECGSRICRVLGSQQLCTTNCSTSDDRCGPGLVCIAATGDTQGVCWPRSITGDPGSGPVPPPPADYCACDTQVGCNSDCDCDPECSDGCTHTQLVSRPRAPVTSLSILLGLGALAFGLRRWGQHVKGP